MRHAIHALLWSVACAGVQVAQQPAAESPAAVAAKTRQEAIKSIEIQFHIKETLEPGSQPGSVTPTPGGKSFPEKQTVIESDNRLVMKGEDIRLESNHPLWDLRTLSFLRRNHVATIRENESKSYYVRADQEVGWEDSVATIKPRRSAHVADDLTMMSFMMHCRGVSRSIEAFSFTSGRWQPTGLTQSINGVQLQQYRLTLGKMYPAGSSVVAWVDPKQDYAVRRLRCDFPKSSTILLDTTFETDPQSGLVLPVRWTDTRLNPNGKVLSTRVHQITSCRVNYAPSATEFDLTFPPNVRVYNEFEGKEYLVRADGSFQPLRGSTVDSAALAEASSSWWWRQRYLFAAGLALLVAAALWLRSRRNRPVSAS